MAVVGYARVSTTDQDLTIQLERLADAGCEKVFSEKRSGKDGARPELRNALEWIREGDVLVVTRLDRLGRSLKDLLEILQIVEGKRCGFRCTEQAIDTTTPVGRLTFQILGACAEFETEIRRERQAEGIAKAKDQGKYRGPPPRVDIAEIHRLKAAGWGTSAIAKKLKIHARTVRRYTPEDLKEEAPEAFRRKSDAVRRPREFDELGA